MRKRTWFIILAIVALTVTSPACGLSSPKPQPADTPMPISTDSPIPTHTSRPSPIDTPTSVPTDTPEPTDIPEPEETPEAVAFDLALEDAQTIRLPARSLAIYNLVGNVEVVPWTGDAIEVDIRPGGKDADSLRVEAGEIDGRQTLRVIFPTRVIALEEPIFPRVLKDLEVHHDGRLGTGLGPGGRRVTIISGSFSEWTVEQRVPSGPRLEAYAQMTIRVPKGVELDLNVGLGTTNAMQTERTLMLYAYTGSVTVRGDVTARDVEGEVEVASGHGDLLLEGIVGHVRAKTDHGDVTARDVEGEVEVASGDGDLLLEGIVKRVTAGTGRGSIRLELAADFAGRLQISTGGGAIDVDVPDAQVVKSSEDAFRHEKILIIGRDGETSTIRTQRGAIYVRRGG